MKNKDNKNKNKIISFVIILLLVIPIIMILYNIEYIMAYKNLNKILETESLEEDVIIPEGILKVINSYDGDVKSYKVVLKSIDDVTKNILPKYYLKVKNFSDEEIKALYEKTHKIIEMELGIENFEDFKDVCDALKRMSGDKLVVKNYYIDTTSVNEIYNRVEATLKVEYEGEQNIDFTIAVKNITKNKFSPIVYKLYKK